MKDHINTYLIHQTEVIMANKTAFCEKCKKMVPYSTDFSEAEEVTFKNQHCNYAVNIARCNICKTEVYVPELDDDNTQNKKEAMIAVRDAYRKANGIIPYEQIREIPKKYNIGKRPLSLVLGWGELTFTRYWSPLNVPTKQYNETLKRVYQEPRFYKELLDQNKNLIHPEAYEKSKLKVDQLLQPDDSSKIEQVINYILGECEDITPLALQKALYYVQGFNYAFHNKFMFNEDCEAWVHGPVYRDIYYKYKDYHFNPIDTTHFPVDSDKLTLDEKKVVDSVINYFCCYSGKALEWFTHDEAPWLNLMHDKSPQDKSHDTIRKEEIGEFFSAIKKEYDMSKPEDIKNYAEAKFKQVYKC